MRVTAFGEFNKELPCRIEVLDHKSDYVQEFNYKDENTLDSLTAK